MSSNSVWLFRLSFSAFAIVTLISKNIAAAIILVAIAIVFAAENSND